MVSEKMKCICVHLELLPAKIPGRNEEEERVAERGECEEYERERRKIVKESKVSSSTLTCSDLKASFKFGKEGKSEREKTEIRTRKILKYSGPWDLTKLQGERERERERERELHPL